MIFNVISLPYQARPIKITKCPSQDEGSWMLPSGMTPNKK
jgi:hypothetical protein